MRRLSIAAVLAMGVTLALSGGAFAKSSCKDASGKFVKCPADTTAAAPAATAAKPAKCKDASGKFTKCPAAGAAPAATPAAPAKAAPAKPAAKEAKPAAAPAGAAATASAAGAPAGATAKCKDGSYSKSKTHSGSCSHHGGVATFL